MTAVTPCYQGLAFSDPSVSIDPAFLAQDPGATLEFSSNIQQFAPARGSIPEPATWVLVALGFAVLGLARARARRCKPREAARSFFENSTEPALRATTGIAGRGL